MTGGGVYPALAVLQTLGDKTQNVLWIGSESQMEIDLLSKQNINFKSIPAAGLHGVGLINLPGNLIKLARGYFKVRRMMNQFRPDVIFYTGGFISIPVTLATRNVPSVVFIPDIEPGASLNFLIKRSTLITTVTEDTRKFIKQNKKIEVTGYPIRSDLSNWTKERGQKEFGLEKDLPVLLVYGGSKGARSINQALYPILVELLNQIQVIHLCGEDNWEETIKVKSNLPQSLSGRYHAFPFLHSQMGAALVSADLVVCRAGASTLGELPFFSLPAILIPYPHAWRYQHTNAEYLTNHGGALLLEDKDLQTKLLVTVMDIIHNRSTLTKMRKSMQALARPKAAQQIGKLLYEVGTSKGGKSKW
jgi:UDP-N-acetylglucosamine--N-acetylmuramyl-(pentapeptide) pyrophosphoryl-undecaprenol N-acetylglucosamine transferase